MVADVGDPLLVLLPLRLSIPKTVIVIVTEIVIVIIINRKSRSRREGGILLALS